MKRIVLGFYAIFAVLATGGTAAALSCLPPSVTNSFHNYNDVDETYRVYVGQWRALETVPDTSGYNQSGRPLPELLYVFESREVGFNGPTGQTQRRTVKVQPKCAGPWCAQYPQQGTSVLAFVEDRGVGISDLYFQESACGGASFPASRSNINTVVNCLNGRSCPRNSTGFDEPIQPVTDACGATGRLQEYIGSRVERVPFNLYPNQARFIRPGDVVTKDYRPNRLNINLNNRAIIQSLSCG